MMLSLGFGSGLPYILLISTTSAWLRDAGLELSLIGFFAWITFAYTVKFIWAPLVDRFSVPYFSKYGHRKSWITLMQIIIISALLLLSNIDPVQSFLFFCIVSGLFAFAVSFQFITFDYFLL